MTKMRAFLLNEKIATEADIDAITASVDREIAEATDAALKAPKPAVDTADSFVFSPDRRSHIVGSSRRRRRPKARPTPWWRRSIAR